MSIKKQPNDLQSSNKVLGNGLKALVLWDLNHSKPQTQISNMETRNCCGCL